MSNTVLNAFIEYNFESIQLEKEKLEKMKEMAQRFFRIADNNVEIQISNDNKHIGLYTDFKVSEDFIKGKWLNGIDDGINKLIDKTIMQAANHATMLRENNINPNQQIDEDVVRASTFYAIKEMLYEIHGDKLEDSIGLQDLFNELQKEMKNTGIQCTEEDLEEFEAFISEHFDIDGVVFNNDELNNVVLAIQNTNMPVAIQDISKYEFNNNTRSIHELNSEYLDALKNNHTNLHNNENASPQDNLKAKQQVLEDLLVNNERTDNGLTRFLIQNGITLNTLIEKINPNVTSVTKPEINAELVNGLIVELENTRGGNETMTYLSTMKFEDLLALNTLRKLSLVEADIEETNICYPDKTISGLKEEYKLSELIDPNIQLKGIKITTTDGGSSAGLFDSINGVGAPCEFKSYSVEIPYSSVVVGSANNCVLMPFGDYSIQEVAGLHSDVFTRNKIEQGITIQDCYLDQNVTNTFNNGLTYEDLEEIFELQQHALKNNTKTLKP